MKNAIQLNTIDIQEILPYLEWIETFKDMKFKEYFSVPIPSIEYTIRTIFPDVGYLPLYTRKTKKMQFLPFCQERKEILGQSIQHATISTILHITNIEEDAQLFCYIYRTKCGKVKDAIRITNKRTINPMEILPKGFHLSQQYITQNDQVNIMDIERHLNSLKSITILTEKPKYMTKIKLKNPLIESSITLKGQIAPELLEMCEKYGYKRTPKKTRKKEWKEYFD